MKTHDLSVNYGEYTNTEGRTVRKWKTVGAMVEGVYGPYIVLDPTVNLAALPANSNGSVQVSMFPVESGPGYKPENFDQKPLSYQPSKELDDEIPF